MNYNISHLYAAITIFGAMSLFPAHVDAQSAANQKARPVGSKVLSPEIPHTGTFAEQNKNLNR